MFVELLIGTPVSFLLLWSLLDLSQCQVHPHAESSSWQRGPAAQPGHQLPETRRLRGVCVSERQALPVPRRERLHLPDHQQCVFMELRAAWGLRPTPEKPSFSSSFPLSCSSTISASTPPLTSVGTRSGRTLGFGVNWTDGSLGLFGYSRSLNLFPLPVWSPFPFDPLFFLWFAFIVGVFLFSFSCLLLHPFFPPCVLLQEFRNRNRLGWKAASSSQSVNGAKTRLGSCFFFSFVSSCFWYSYFCMTLRPGWRLVGKFAERPTDRANENEHTHTFACARSRGCVCFSKEAIHRCLCCCRKSTRSPGTILQSQQQNTPAKRGPLINVYLRFENC